MQEAIYKLAANVSTPLALAGLTVALFCRVILAVIKADLLTQVGAGASAAIIKKVINVFFILSLVAAVFGFVGWMYTKAIREKRQTTAIEAFSHLVTTMRTETDRLMLEYPGAYKSLIAQGRTPDEARDQIAATFRHRIDTTVAGDKLGTQMRAGFPDYPWGYFFAEGKDHFRQFLNAVHEAALREQSEAMRDKITEMRKDYMHHLEQRLAELRFRIGG
jgi:hypothetical protein